MKRNLILAVVFMLAMSCTAVFADSVPVVGDFDNGTFMFTGFTANTFTGFTQPANSLNIFHDHGNTSVVFTLNIHLDGNWVTIATTQANGSDVNISNFTNAPISFALGTVDGIQLLNNPGVFQAYHLQGGAEANFTTENATPEPGSLALLGSGLLGLGGAIRRKLIA
jgi:hypothetical protein